MLLYKSQNQFIVTSFISMIVSTVLFFVIIFLLFFVGDDGTVANSKIVNSMNYIQMTAKNGFTPNYFSVKSGLPTSLKIITNGTFDCSSIVNIPKLNISKNLPFTGETEISIPSQIVGTRIEGYCSMGMYKFTVDIV